MPPETPIARLSPDEVGEVLRRAGVKGARFSGRPTVEEVAEATGSTPEAVRAVVGQLRALGQMIDAPSGDLEAIRVSAQDLERPEEDPRFLHRVATENAGIEVETGMGKLPRATRWVLILGGLAFVAMLLFALTRTPTP